MKLILEYRKPNSRWLSLSQELKVTTHSEVEMNVFGYWLCGGSRWDKFCNEWSKYDEEVIKFIPSKFTLNVRPCTKTVSQATLGNLYDFQTVGFNNEVPISKSTLKVEPQNVALLSMTEYETCLNGAQSILEYEALLAAAKHIEGCGYEVRFFAFNS